MDVATGSPSTLARKAATSSASSTEAGRNAEAYSGDISLPAAETAIMSSTVSAESGTMSSPGGFPGSSTIGAIAISGGRSETRKPRSPATDSCVGSSPSRSQRIRLWRPGRRADDDVTRQPHGGAMTFLAYGQA